MKVNCDFLVIGTGVAGLFYALKVSKYGSVALIAKDKINDTSTSKAQGGIAGVTSQFDSYDKHINDTIIAGCGVNDPKIVEIVVKE